MKTALITGVTGQLGSYMADYLVGERDDYKVVGMTRRQSNPNYENLMHGMLFALPNKFRLIQGDLMDKNSLRDVLKEVNPDEIYHFAAQSHVGVSFGQPELTFNINAVGTQRLLEAVKEVCPAAKVYNACTSEMFGTSALHTKPQNENTPFMPISPYGIAKVAAFHFSRYYREAYGMFIVNGISFNCDSPRRGPEFVSRKITLGLAQILEGKRDRILLGNITPKRDWGFAGDYIKAMWLMLQEEKPDDYVIATGESHSVFEMMCTAFEVAKEYDYKHYLPVGTYVQDFFIPGPSDRKIEIPNLVGDSTKLRNKFGWKPTVNFEELIRMMVVSDIQKVRRK